MDKRSISQRHHNIDLLECIAIFFVVILHSNLDNWDWMKCPSTLTYLRYYIRTLLAVCVPIFFFCNGYLLLNREFNLKKHIQKSIKLSIITLIWAAIGIIQYMYANSRILSIKEIYISIRDWSIGGWISHYWYMGILICIYVFFPIVKYVYDNERILFNYFVIISAILTFGNKAVCNVASMMANIFLNKQIYIKINIFLSFNPFRNLYWYTFVYFAMGGGIL